MSDFLVGFVNEDEDILSKYEKPEKEKDRAKNEADFTKKTNVIKLTAKIGKATEDIVLTPLKKSPFLFLNKSVIFYGPSGSGKTYAIYHFMYIMRKLFPTCFVFAPTEGEKGDFSKHVPFPLIYEEFGINEIRNIYLRQKSATSVYNAANDLEILNGLFLKVANSHAKRYLKKIMSLKHVVKNKVNETKDADVRKAKLEELEDIFKRNVINFYKSVIGPHAKKLMLMDKLSEKEKYALRFLYFNPKTLVIFDDSTTELLEIIKEGKRKVRGENSKDNEIIKHFYFKGRWANITHFYSFHDDGHLDTDIRKNAFYSIFCEKQVALSYFQRSANNFGSADKKRAEAIISMIFSETRMNDPNTKHTKLVYCRPEKKFYYFIADRVPKKFMMCAKHVQKYCSRVERKGSSMDMNNPFAKKFVESLSF
jgi:hypothetical protein